MPHTRRPEAAPQEATLTSRFSFSEPTLLFSRARLYPDHIQLDGWHWRGRYRLCVPLARVLQADITPTGRLLLWLHTGETLRLRLDDPDRWKRAIEHHRGPAPSPSL